MRTVPRRWSSPTMNGSNATVAVPVASTSTERVATSRPSSSSVTGTRVASFVPRFTSRADAVTCSPAENGSRSNDTEAMLRFEVSASATEIGLSTTPSAKAIPSSPAHPFFWKSEIKIASRSETSETSRIPSASFSAGPNRVTSTPTSARVIADRTLA